MQINSLLNRLNKQEKKPLVKYLSLVIASETVHSAVWVIDQDQPKIIATGSLEEYSTSEKLLTAADASLATALENISPEPNQVLLGLPHNWVKADKITSEKKQVIKTLSDKLSLKPIGFVVVPEAIVTFIKSKEGTPLTGILIELTETEATVTLVKLGKIQGSHIVGRSDDLGSDVEEGLARFESDDSLPSRMLLVGANLDLEACRQTLISYNWQEKLPFLHIPKIETLDQDIPLRAVVTAAGNKAKPAPAPTPASSDTLASVGFSKKDIAHEKPDPKPDPKSHQESSKHLSPEPLSQSQPQSHPHPQPHSKPHAKSQPDLHQKPKHSIFDTLKQTMSKVFKKLSHLPRLPLIIGSSILALLIFLFFAYFTFPKADVVLYLNPKTIEKDIDFTVASGKDTSVSKMRLRGEVIEVEVTDESEIDTTGEALVGEKATGQVTIYNKTNSLKKFPAGTILIGPQSLQFQLDSDTKIASQSATDTGITFGTETASLTASRVGSDSNISNNTQLTIKGFDSSTYSAKATKDFSGGSSQQVRSVSEEDKDNLLDQLTQKIVESSETEFDNLVQSDESYINSDFDTEEVSKKYTKALGEEADTLGLKLTLKVSTLKFKTSDLLLLVQEDVDDKMPEGYQAIGEASQMDIQDASISSGVADVSAALTTNLIPQLQSQELINYLAGKYPQNTQDFLKSIPSFSRVDIQLKPKLPKFLSRFPQRPQNINLEIKVEQ